MPSNLKKLNKGLGNYRGGLAHKTGKKLKIADFEVKARPGLKTLTFISTVHSEHSAVRRKEAADQKSKIGKINPVTGKKYSYDGKAPPAPKYKVSLNFQDVIFSKDKTEKAPQSAKIIGLDKLIFFELPNARTAKISLTCSCPDHRHSFSWPLAKEGALIGNKMKYTRVTPARKGDPDDPKSYVRPTNPKNPNPYGKDFVNPDNEMGYCKHVFSVLKFLKLNGYVRE